MFGAAGASRDAKGQYRKPRRNKGEVHYELQGDGRALVAEWSFGNVRNGPTSAEYFDRPSLRQMAIKRVPSRRQDVHGNGHRERGYRRKKKSAHSQITLGIPSSSSDWP